MPVGPQYSIDDREDVAVHEDAPGLPGAKRPSSPQACRRWKVVWPASGLTPKRSNSNCVLTSPSPVGMPAVDAEPALPHARPEVAVLAELVRKRRQLRRAQDVEPVRVDLVEVVDHVELRKPVDLHSGPRLQRNGRRGSGLALGRHLDRDLGHRQGGCLDPRRTQRKVGDGRGPFSNGHAGRKTRGEPGHFDRDVVDTGREHLNPICAAPARQAGRPKTGGDVAHADDGPGHRRPGAVDDSARDGSGLGLRRPGKKKEEKRGNGGGESAWAHWSLHVKRRTDNPAVRSEPPDSPASSPRWDRSGPSEKAARTLRMRWAPMARPCGSAVAWRHGGSTDVAPALRVRLEAYRLDKDDHPGRE